MKDICENVIRELAAHKHLPDAHLSRWLAMDEVSATALLEMAQELKLRTGQLVAAIDLLDEIAVREKIAPHAILIRDDLRRASHGAGSTPDRAAAFLATLRAIRFPRLTQMQNRLAAEIASLKLPRGVRVRLPEELRSDELAIEFSARTPRELARLIDALAECKAGLMRIAEMLGDHGTMK